jgi:hypothetical protein
MTRWPGDCAECGKLLNALDVKHGWVTEQVTYRVQTRVHTVCRARFRERPLDEQIARAAKVDQRG